MAYQYIRSSRLIIGPAAGGNGIDLSNMHITFNVARATISTPQTAHIRVYNLADTTVQQLFALSPSAGQPDGGQVLLSAGYAGAVQGAQPGQVITPSANSQANVGLIFSGSIRQLVKGRESQTDTYVDIIAADGDQPYNYGTINATLAAGWTQGDVADQLVQALGPFKITQGVNAPLATTRNARGKVLYGMARDVGRKLGANNGCDWMLINGQAVTISRSGALPGAAFEINEASGLIGYPQQTLNGIEMQTLLNPNLVVGSIIRINNADIIDFALSTDYTATQFVPSTQNDGYYRIYWLERQGDTRGNDWYNHIVCVGTSSPAPITSQYIDTVG